MNVSNNSADVSAAPRDRRRDLLHVPEGRMLVTGLVLSMVYVAVLMLTSFEWPELSQELVGMTAINVLFGRAAGMSFGYSAGHEHALVVSVNMAVETLLVLLIYPLFVFHWQHLVEIPWLSKTMKRLHEAAERHQDKIQRYGVPGLFLFVWFPFWMTGPLVGCIIGYLLGVRLSIVLTVVLSGTYLAMVSWAFLLHEIHERVAAYNPSGPMILVVILILIAVGAQVLNNARKNKRAR